MLKIVNTALLGLLLANAGIAHGQVSTADPDLPIAFTNVVADVCFGVANGRALNPKLATALQLERVTGRPAALRGAYGHVPEWYRATNKPRNIFIGVGDAPNRCHIVLADTKDAKQAHRNLTMVLKAGGFTGIEDRSDQAITLYVKRSPVGNMLVLLKGLADAVDGVGPQVSVDVSSAPDDVLKSLLGTR